MSDAAEPGLERRLRELRQAFDESFARPIESAAGGDRVRALRLQVGASAYAVTLDGCGALVPSPAVHPLPGAHPGFAGLAMVQGVMLPVYVLATLLSSPPGDRLPAWMLVTRGTDPVGLLVDGAEGPDVVEQADGERVATILFRGTPTRLLPLDGIVDDLRRELERRRADGGETR